MSFNTLRNSVGIMATALALSGCTTISERTQRLVDGKILTDERTALIIGGGTSRSPSGYTVVAKGFESPLDDLAVHTKMSSGESEKSLRGHGDLSNIGEPLTGLPSENKSISITGGNGSVTGEGMKKLFSDDLEVNRLWSKNPPAQGKLQQKKSAEPKAVVKK